MLNLVMNLQTTSAAIVSDTTSSVLLGPALGVLAAVALLGSIYGVAVLAAALLHGGSDRTVCDPQVAPAKPLPQVLPSGPVGPAAWTMTPTISLLLRSACDGTRVGGQRTALPGAAVSDVGQRISSPRAAV